MVKPYDILSPVGLDRAIRNAQNRLRQIDWLGDYVYGRAYLQREAISDKANQRIVYSTASRRPEISFPEIWGKNREPYSLMPDDSVQAYCFFYVPDEGEFQANNIAPVTQLKMRQPVRLIVWGDLRRIDSTKEYRYSEELKVQILNWLKQTPGYEFSSTLENFDDIFSDFTITENMRQYIKPPYWGMRIDGYLSYSLLPENGECGDCLECGEIDLNYSGDCVSYNIQYNLTS